MGYKYFGRLAGSTPAANAVTLTSPANTSTPFTAVLPASKFLAQGENATSNVFNRGLAALSVNTDALAGVLDSPALRNEVLEPRPVGVGQPGYSALVGVAAGAQDVNLSAGADRPVTWVHVGLHRDLLSRHLQAERVSALADGRQLLTPTDVFLNATLAGTSTSYFPTTQYTGTSDNALALRIPGVVAVATGLPPYSGAPAPSAVGSFDADGCRLSSRSWEDLYARPGCLVSISGSGSNRGLYRIANMSGGATAGTAKAVLTRAYTEVTVLDGTLYSAGDLVGWRPSNQAVAGVVTDYVHRAYVVFKIATGVNDEAVLYLSDVGGSEDLKIQGTSVAHKANPASSGTSSISRYGLVDLEAGATQNASFVVGALLLNLATVGANPVANHASTILGILPANHPVKFETAAAAYNATVCAPPGYVLNPVVRLPANSMGGDFRLHAQSLTTAGENLRTGGGTASKGSFAPSTRLEFSPGYQSVMEGFLSWAHRGDDAGTGAGAQSSLFAPTRQVLGEGLWHITFTANLPSIPAGTAVSIVPQPTYTAYVAKVVRASGTSLWVKRVHLDGKQYDNDHPAIAAGGTMLYSAVTYTVATVSEPGLESTVGVYVPDDGLNAAYHNHYSADPGIRGNQGKGNRIKAADNRPLTVELPSTDDDQVGLRVESDRQGSGQRYTVLRANARGTALGTSPDMALEVVDGTTLRIKDANATAGVRLSSASDTALAVGLGTNIIGAFNTLNTGLGVETARVNELTSLNGAALAAGVLSGLGVSAGALLLANVASGYIMLNGTRLAITGTSVVLTNNTAQFISYDPAGGMLTATPTLAPGYIPLARLTTSGGSIVVGSIRDIRLFVGPLNHRVDLHVGGAGAHFTTLRAAVDFVNVMSATGVANGNRSWRIFVRGNTTETDTIVFLTDNVSIFGAGPSVLGGVGGSSQDVARVTWSGDIALFDLNGRSGITIRDLSLFYDATSATATATISRVAFDDSSVSGPTGALIERVSVGASSGVRMHGYIRSSGGGTWNECRITGCYFTRGTEFGILAEMQRCWIEKCVFWQTGTSSQNATVGFQGAIVVTGPASVAKVWITDCEFVTIKNKAIDIDGGGVTVSGCTIWQSTKEGSGVTEWVGINIKSTAFSYTIRDNLIDNVGGTSSVNATGIRTAGGVGHILNNDIDVAPTAVATAVDLTSYSVGVRVDGNVLSGGLLTIAGGPHYVGIGNA